MKKHMRKILFLCIIVVITIILLIIKNVTGGAQWYATHIFPLVTNSIGRIISVIPFSVYEFILYGVALIILFSMIKLIVKLIRKPKEFPKMLGIYMMRLLCFSSLVFMILVANNLILYNRTPFAQIAGLTIEKSSTEELKELSWSLVNRLNQVSTKILLNPAGYAALPNDLHNKAKESMANLGETYEELKGFYPNPKPVTFSKGMSYMNLTGMYSPFTIEANYNKDVPRYSIPDTICHELAHLKGFIKEDEAGFIAYLACENSDDPNFVYSGNMSAFIYATNALYGAGEVEEYSKLMDALSPQVRKDLSYNSQYWKEFEGKVATISEAANDTYLKANNQTDGTRSYGRMVDLLLAHYKMVNGK